MLSSCILIIKIMTNKTEQALIKTARNYRDYGKLRFVLQILDTLFCLNLALQFMDQNLSHLVRSSEAIQIFYRIVYIANAIYMHIMIFVTVVLS